MGFLDRMVSDLIRKSTGFNARPFVRAVGGKNILLLGGAAVAGVLAAEQMQGARSQPDATPPPPPPPGATSTKPPLPPIPNAPPPPPPVPVSEAEEELPNDLLYAIVRTMTASALADGHLGPREKEAIHRRLGESGLRPEQIEQIHKELLLPATPEELAALVEDPSDRELLFRFAALVGLADDSVSEVERAWLSKLANALGIAEGRSEEIVGEVFD